MSAQDVLDAQADRLGKVADAIATQAEGMCKAVMAGQEVSVGFEGGQGGVTVLLDEHGHPVVRSYLTLPQDVPAGASVAAQLAFNAQTMVMLGALLAMLAPLAPFAEGGPGEQEVH